MTAPGLPSEVEGLARDLFLAMPGRMLLDGDDLPENAVEDMNAIARYVLVRLTAARRAAVEDAAKECERLAALYKTMSEIPYRIGQVDGCGSCALALRTLCAPAAGRPVPGA